MPDEQRAQLKQLAEAATPGPWWVREGLVMAGDAVGINQMVTGEFEPVPCAIEDATYIASVSPDIVLATLAYVNALENEVQRLTDSTVSNEVYEARTDAYVATIDKLCAQVRQLTDQLTPGSLTERAPTQWAYEQACAALEKHRLRADVAQAQVAKVYELLDKEFDQHHKDGQSNCTPQQAQFYQHCQGAIAMLRMHLEAEVPEPKPAE